MINLIQTAQREGIEIILDGQDLLLDYEKEPSPNLLASIKANKQAIIDSLLCGNLPERCTPPAAEDKTCLIEKEVSSRNAGPWTKYFRKQDLPQAELDAAHKRIALNRSQGVSDPNTVLQFFAAWCFSRTLAWELLTKDAEESTKTTTQEQDNLL